jgi:pilus assembly protein CpaE
MNPLKVIAVASSEEARIKLLKQLKGLDFISFDGVVLELSDAQQLWQKQKPDLLIIDLTGRELDACLFIEVINYNVESKTVVFGLHRELDPNIILKAVSSGVKEFIQYPQDPAALEAALEKHWKFMQKVAQSQKSGVEDDKGMVVPVFGSKGGVGASTVAVNLAHQLRLITRKPVVLFDMDQVFGNVAVMLNFKASYAVSDLASEAVNEVDDDLLRKIIINHETGLDIVVACKSVLDENPLISPELLGRIMVFLRENYQYVVIDLPTHVVDPYHQYFMENADEILLVSSLDIPGLYRTRQYLELVKRHLDMEKVKLILNRCDLKAAVGMSNESIEEEFKYPVYARLPNNWALNVESMSLGQTLGMVSPQADLVKAYQDLAAKLSGISLAEQNGSKKADKQMGLLGRLTRRNSACH